MLCCLTGTQDGILCYSTPQTAQISPVPMILWGEAEDGAYRQGCPLFKNQVNAFMESQAEFRPVFSHLLWKYNAKVDI